MKQQISASILSADFLHLGEEALNMERAGADRLHVDVMDGHFVPNLSMGVPVVQALRAVTRLPLDVHLMVQGPEKMIPSFAKAGADSITFHIEATSDPKAVLAQIRQEKKQAGLTLKPATPVEKLFPFLPCLDLVLIMTVEPGFGGQTLLPDQVSKMATIRKEISRQGLNNIKIHVDGGVNDKTQALLSSANVLVSGNFLFGHKDYKTAISCLKHPSPAHS